MTTIEANNLKLDIEKEISEEDYCDDLYLSINGVGTKTFRQSVVHRAENWIFIWTKDESFVINEDEIGDFVLIPINRDEICK
jgi:hypothetical protein